MSIIEPFSDQFLCQQCLSIPFVNSYMNLAFEEAEQALKDGEVAVGCVFVDYITDNVVARGHNCTNVEKNALSHAEFVALRKISNVKENLSHLVLYVTVEPCIMCAAMLRYNGIRQVFFGCKNSRFGGNGTILNVHSMDIGTETANEDGGHAFRTFLQPYRSKGGYQDERAIKLLQDFYSLENPNAPLSKRRRKEIQ